MTPTKRPIILPGDAEVYGNLKLNGNELQNVNMQNLQTAPQNATEGRFYIDTVTHKPKYHNGTEFVSFGETYTNGTGIDITNNEISIDDTVALKDDIPDISGKADNNAVVHKTGNEEIEGNKGFVIQKNGASGGSIKFYNYETSDYSGQANTYETIGDFTFSYNDSVNDNDGAIVYETVRGIDNVISSKSDLILRAYDKIYVTTGRTGTPYELIDPSTGKITDARLSNNIARTSQIPTVPTNLSSFTDDLGSSPTHTHSQYLNSSLKGANNGLAELDANGKIPISQIPGAIDEVIDSYIVSGATALSSGWLSKTSGGSALTPETGVIYVVLSSGTYLNKTYRWSGSTYVEISASPGQASETSAGIAEIATTAEVTAGTDDTRMVTPSKLAGAFTSYNSKTKTLTNTTFNANGTGNSISNLEVADFATGVVRKQSDGIRTVSNASDSSFATEKAIADAIKNFITGITSSDVITALGFTPVKKYATNNPALTVTNNYGTWIINTGISSSDLNVNFYDITNDGNSVMYPSYNVNNGVITAWIYSTSNISADKIRVVVTG